MASALLAAALPENAPFMADECLKAIPDIEGIDYTTREYLKFVTHIESTRDRLNGENSGTDKWSAHSYVLSRKTCEHFSKPLLITELNLPFGHILWLMI